MQEAIKPLMRSGDADARRGSQDTLYTCIDFGLRLLHPFMPFVTEELWQRIPRRKDSYEVSVMVAQYPTPVCISGRFTLSLLLLQESTAAWRDEVLENTVKLTLEITRAARSMRDTYKIKPAVRLQIFLSMFFLQ